MMKLTASIVLLLLPLLGISQSINLEDLIEKAKNNSPQKSQIALINQLTDLQVKQLSGSNLPQTSIGGQATWQSEVTSLPITIPNIDIELPAQDQYKLTLDFQQNIWDGGLSTSQKRMALAGQKVELNKIETNLLKTEEQVISMYFGAIFSERQKANATLMLTELNSNISKMEAAVSNGIATKSQLLALSAKKLELEQQLIEIDKRKQSAMEGLGLLTGQNISESAILEKPENFENADQTNERPELSLLNAQQASIMASESLIKAKNMPKISLFGSGGYGRPGLNFLARDFSPFFIGGLQLKVPLSHLYNGGQNNDLQQNRINQMRLEKQKESFLMASEVQLNSQKSEVERLNALIESDRKLIEMRSQIKDVAQAQLDNGLITASEYLSELNKEDLAKQALILHEVQLLQTKRNIKLLLGQ